MIFVVRNIKYEICSKKTTFCLLNQRHKNFVNLHFKVLWILLLLFTTWISLTNLFLNDIGIVESFFAHRLLVRFESQTYKSVGNQLFLFILIRITWLHTNFIKSSWLWSSYFVNLWKVVSIISEPDETPSLLVQF
jgi:hypothetical protein